MLITSLDEGIVQLDCIRGSSAVLIGVDSLRSICGEGTLRWSKMVLEEQVVLVSYTTNTSENSTSHEVISITAETINNVVVVPDIKLRNLTVGEGKGLGSVPADVVVEVVFVTLCAELFVEREMSSLVRRTNVSPGSQRTVNSDTVVVDLVTTTNHDVERLLLMHAQDIVPEGASRPGVSVGTDGEAIARVKHDSHRVGLGGDVERLGTRSDGLLGIDIFGAGDSVLPLGLLSQEWHLDVEAPESALGVLVQLDTVNLSGELNSACAADDKLRLSLSRGGNNQNTAMPCRVVRLLAAHVSVVEQRSAQSLDMIGGAKNLRAFANSGSAIFSCSRNGSLCAVRVYGVVGTEGRVLMASESMLNGIAGRASR